MKKAVAIIVTIVAFLAVFLVVLSYNTLVTVTVPDTIIEYKANYIEFDDAVVGGVLPDDYVDFQRGSYSFITDEIAEVVFDDVLDQWNDNGNAYIEGMAINGRVSLRRYRSNVYDVGSNVQYNVGVPIYADVSIKRSSVPNGYIYTVTLLGYYIEFSFEQFAYNGTYTLDYQEYMRDNTPSLQRPQKPNYEGENTIEVVRHFFEYVGSSVEYLFTKLEYYANYVTFYVQDFAVLFKFI